MPRLLSLVPGRTDATRLFVSHLAVALEGDETAVIAVLEAMAAFSGPIPVLTSAERAAFGPHIAALPHTRSVSAVNAALAKAMAVPVSIARGEQDPVRPKKIIATAAKRKAVVPVNPAPAKRRAVSTGLRNHEPKSAAATMSQALTTHMATLLPRHKIAHVLAMTDNHAALLRIITATAAGRRQDAVAFAVTLAAQASCPPRLISLLNDAAVKDAVHMRDMVRLFAYDHRLVQDAARSPDRFAMLARAVALHGDASTLLVLDLIAEAKDLGIDLAEPLTYDHGAARLVFLLTRPRHHRFPDDNMGMPENDDEADMEKDATSSDTEEEETAASVLALDALGRRAAAMIECLGKYETGAWRPRLDAAVALAHLYRAITSSGHGGDMYAETARRAGTNRGRVSALLSYGRVAIACPEFVHIMTDASSPIRPPSWHSLHGGIFSYKRFMALMPAITAMWHARNP